MMNRRRAADIEALKLAFFENAGRPCDADALRRSATVAAEVPMAELAVAAASLRREAPAESGRKIKVG